MKNKSVVLFAAVALTLAAVVMGCASTASKEAAKTQRMESRLTQCGFKAVPASTPQQTQQLQLLPAGKLSVVLRNGKHYYVFPDVARNMLYVGRTPQFLAYQQLLSNLEENEQYDQMSKMDPSIAAYNNQAETLEGTATVVDWSWDSK